LGGIQGLVNTRNSFSKYCLQYSPVPVITVRPTEKRNKKKEKRANDSSRKTYFSMLASSDGKHEADSEGTSPFELEDKISADEEASQVAKALGLPAKFDPTIKPLNHPFLPRTSSRASSPQPPPSPPENRRVVNAQASQAGNDSDEEEEEDEEGDFEVMSGEQALNEQQKLAQLHKMEVGEAAALKMGVDDEDDDDDDTTQAHAGASVS
jgi:hypothetical protein